MLESVTFKINYDDELERIQDFIAANKDLEVKKNRSKKQWTFEEVLALAVRRAGREDEISESSIITAKQNPDMGRCVCVVERKGGYKMGVSQCKNNEPFDVSFGAALAYVRAMGWNDLSDLLVSTLN